MYRRRVNLKGTLPALVLEVLRRGPSHGYEIAQTIKRSSAGVLDFKEGTLYPALHTLENDGLIESDVAIVVQHTRLDSRQPALALMSTMAFPAA